MKVFSGMCFVNGIQMRACVGTKSQKRVAEITGQSLYHVRGYWSESGNLNQKIATTANPETLLVTCSRHSIDEQWLPVINFNETKDEL